MNKGKPRAISVLVVDDHEVVLAGIRSVLQLASDIRVAGTSDTAAGGLAEAARVQPDVVLLDIRLPDRSGIDVCRDILSACPQTRVLFLTSYADEDTVRAAVLAGAHGYVLKDIRTTALVETIRSVASGESLLDPTVAKRTLSWLRNRAVKQATSNLRRLSPQEERILPLVAQGKTNKEIAVAMTLSEKTVKNYLANMYDKLGITRRSQAAAFYVEQGRNEIGPCFE